MLLFFVKFYQIMIRNHIFNGQNFATFREKAQNFATNWIFPTYIVGFVSGDNIFVGFLVPEQSIYQKLELGVNPICHSQKQQHLKKKI